MQLLNIDYDELEVRANNLYAWGYSLVEIMQELGHDGVFIENGYVYVY